MPGGVLVHSLRRLGQRHKAAIRCDAGQIRAHPVDVQFGPVGRIGRDPALGSSVVLTFITDGMGFFIFLGLATLFLV